MTSQVPWPRKYGLLRKPHIAATGWFELEPMLGIRFQLDDENGGLVLHTSRVVEIQKVTTFPGTKIVEFKTRSGSVYTLEIQDEVRA